MQASAVGSSVARVYAQDDARRRDEIEREILAIRREEREMARTAAAMQAESDRVAHDIEADERAIDQELRREHCGLAPEHPPPWDAGRDDAR